MEQYELFHSIPVTIRSKRHLPTGRHVSRAQGSQYRFRGDVEGRAAAVMITWRAHHDQSLPAARRAISRNIASAASPRRWCSSSVMSGTSPNLLLRRFAVTITDLRSSLAGGGTSGSGLCFPMLGGERRLLTIAGPVSGTAFRFRGGRL